MSEALGFEQTCQAHPDVIVSQRCASCLRPICDTCAFALGKSRFCFDCLSAGPTQRERSFSLGYAAASIACAFLGGAADIGAMLQVVPKGTVQLFGVLMVAFPIAGMTFGLLGKDYARKTGSPLPLIGIVANGVLMAIVVVFAIIGTMKR